MLVVDANILIRAVLGVRVRNLIAKYSADVEFFAPDRAWAEAWEHLPAILTKRGIPVEPALSLLNWLAEIIQPVDVDAYGSFEHLPARAFEAGIRTIGRFLQLRSRSAPRFGPRTMISLEPVWRHGRRIESSCSSAPPT